MDDNSCVPDPFYGSTYKLLTKVSSHPLAQVIDIHLVGNPFKYPFIMLYVLLTTISLVHLNWKPHILSFNDKIP